MELFSASSVQEICCGNYTNMLLPTILLQLTHFISIFFFKSNRQMFCNRYGPKFVKCMLNSNEAERGERSGVEA
jgi:hypothetical protein